MLVRIDEGETITRSESRELVILLERPDLTITWMRHRPGEHGTDPHVHRQHVDAFYVLEGVVAFPVGPDGERVSLAAGGFVAVPPGLVHAFVNDGSVEARWLNFHAPDAGFAEYLRGRDGFDSFDPPADGGRPAADAVIAHTVPEAGTGVPPDLWVVEGEQEEPDAYCVRVGEGRFVTVRADVRL